VVDPAAGGDRASGVAGAQVGDGVMIALGVTLTATGHPIHPHLRVDFRRFSEPIVIEDKVWIGSYAVVLPGVRIGYGAVLGGGSVVTHDVPAMTVALGAPRRVVRPITDAGVVPWTVVLMQKLPPRVPPSVFRPAAR
jgi:galactoside O-acetyltransferase